MKKFWKVLGIIEAVVAWTATALIIREFLRK